jgi:carbonic anhydrase
MQKLLRGIVEFRKTRRADYAETFARLALGQHPDALLIACSDSRVAPNLFASVEPGDLFVVRNIGNIVPPFTSSSEPGGRSVAAAVELALGDLPVRDVIVCGHSECAAIRAIHEARPLADAPHLAAWLQYGADARADAGPPPAGLSALNHLSQRSVLRQVENLRTYPLVRNAESFGRLRLHAWWFDIARAEVLDYDDPSDRFVPLDEARVARLLVRPS